jgi:hypothetical protein
MARYEVRVRGRLDPPDAVVSGFRVVEESSSTLLSGQVPGRAALCAVLGELQGQGLDIVEIHKVVGPADSTGVTPCGCAPEGGPRRCAHDEAPAR